jgi:hypothetical protein
MEQLKKVLAVACSKVGTKELTGKNDGEFVDECLNLVGLDNQEYIAKTGKGYAWCAAFISWVFATAGVTALKQAWAPSWFPASKLIKDGFRPMDVFGINYNNIENGHVGFILYWPYEGELFFSLEGNWGNCVGINIRKKSEVNAVSRWI